MRNQLAEDINKLLDLNNSFLKNRIKVKKLHPEAFLPFRANEADAGGDLASVENMVIPAGQRALISTGIAIENNNPNTYFQIAPRSGLAVKYGIDVFAGIVDQNYTGEIKVVLFNSGDKDYKINIGDRIAQIIQVHISIPEFEWVEELNITERGSNGFGSTGN